MATDARVVVRVFLYGIEPEIWRRFSVPDELTFEEFHEVIQKAMGWEDEGQHEFRAEHRAPCPASWANHREKGGIPWQY